MFVSSEESSDNKPEIGDKKLNEHGKNVIWDGHQWI